MSLLPPLTPGRSPPVSWLQTPWPTAPDSSTKQDHSQHTFRHDTPPPTPHLNMAKPERWVPTPARSPHTMSGPCDERVSLEPALSSHRIPQAPHASTATPPAKSTIRNTRDAVTLLPNPRPPPHTSHQCFSSGLLTLPPHRAARMTHSEHRS